ncbi:Mitochondrial distribution and morphology protein 12 [Coemansia sp. Benny D115]|nr:Mitochondrial distribution and morphology protein 12 [Coemansia sp. Benny D115]
MSFTIYWEKLDKKVAQSVQAQLNSFFSNLEERPGFLGEIAVEELDFGSVPPYLEIMDMTEPFPEFYMATEDDTNNTVTGPYTVPTPSQMDGPAAEARDGRMAEYGGIDDDMQSVLSRLPDRPLSQATVRSYFGPRMDMVMGSGAQTPVPRVWNSAGPLYSTQQQQQQNQQLRRRDVSGYFTERGSFSDQSRVAMVGDVVVERSLDDMQLTARVQYCGDMSVVLRTELQLNYPATQFASLPVRLHITKVEFAATAVVAYLHDRINFCFLEPEAPRTSLLDGFAIRTEIGDAHQHVLKNVEKLERFITEQLRRAIDEDFVFPAYHSFETA